MTPSIRVDCGPGEARVAVWDGTLRDYALWRPGCPDGVGDVYRGRVAARVPAMAGAFVALPGAEGFLPDSAGAKSARVGDILGVRIVRAAQGGKGPRLAGKLSPEDAAMVGTGPPALLRHGPNPVERLATLWPQAGVLISDPAVVAALRATLGRRAFLTAAVFDDDGIEAAIAELHQPTATLPGGARLHVYPTPALVALDVDLGSASGEQRGKAPAQQSANLALIPALAAQIRLRNLGGAILVDFGGMSARRRAALGPALAESLAHDPVRPRLLGFTGLGLAEIVRARIHPPLHELLLGPHAAALAALAAAEAQARSDPGHAPVIACSPTVHAALDGDAQARADFSRRTGHAVHAVSDPSLPSDGWRVA